MGIKATCFVLVLALGCISLTSAEWSWGKKSKKQEAHAKEEVPPEQETTGVETREQAARALNLESPPVPEGLLPLESFETHAELQAPPSAVANDEGRSGRIFGIPEKLCKLGIKGMCDKKGYPAAEVLNHYAQPAVSSYSDYDEHSSGYEIHTQNSYQAPQLSYQVPPKNVGYKHSTLNQQAQVNSFPKPTYSAPNPTFVSGSYTPPKPQVYEAPVQSHTKHSYKKQGHSQFIKKTSGQIHPDPVVHQKIETKIVPSVSEVHYHTHNHVYGDKQGNNVGRIGASKSQISQHKSIPEASTHFQVIDQKSSSTQERYPPLDSQISSSFSADSFAPSQPVPFINNFQTGQEKRQITHSSSNVHQSFNNNGHVATLPTFHPGKTAGGFHGSGSVNGFHAGNAKEFGVFQDNKSSFFASDHQAKEGKELHATGNHFSSFSQNSLNQHQYADDCHCIPYQYCAPSDLVARTDPNDFSQLLDARNNPNDILSNGSLPEDYYDYDYFYDTSNATDSDTTESPDQEEEEEEEEEKEEKEEKGEKEDMSLEDAKESNQTKSEDDKARRRRRSTKKEEKEEEKKPKQEGLEGRQLTGYTPGINGCGHNHVCCRRPVYKPPKPLPVCGKGNPSIHGRVTSVEYENGQSDFGEYPWQAAILKEDGEDSMFVCGATLIDSRHLLTAAHCVNDLAVNLLIIRLGEWDVNRDTEFYTHVEVPVAGVFIHPDFYKGNLYNDIAVIRLAYDVDISSSPHISPVCLPSPNSIFTNHRCQVTGWGKDAFGNNGKFQHILKELELPVVDRYVCENALRTTRLGRQYKLHDGFICAGGEFGKDACKGDGGGPLVCATSDKTFELAGIVSWGIGCGQEGVPGVYVNIPYYVDWIKSITRV